MKRGTLTQLIAMALMLVFLAGAGVTATQLTASSGRHKLEYATQSVEGDPPQVALGIAMGAFRGVFVNLLWIRANDLKEEGKYHEAINLAKAITTLQPRFPKVWQFHAWNMAYNISVKTQTLEERWEWVNKGIRLLREQGIVYNPNDLQIHRELAWIHLHKIAGWADDANQYYKRRFAFDWTVLMGSPPPPSPEMRTRASATEMYASWLETIADADSIEHLLATDDTAARLAETIEREFGQRPDESILIRYEMHRAIMDSPLREAILGQRGPMTRSFIELLEAPEYDEAWDALINAIRRDVLTKSYNMDLRRMVRYTRKYGPLDWRHPAAHAAYWAAKGVEDSWDRVNDQNKGDFDFVNADRMVAQAIQELYRSGEIYFDILDFQLTGSDEQSFFLSLPNAHFVDTYGEIVAEARTRGEIYENVKKRVWTMHSAGYENFLKDAIRMFYRRGDTERAEHYYDLLGTMPEQNLNDDRRAQIYSVPLEEFIRRQFQDERFRTHYVASSEVYASLMGAFAALTVGDTELFMNQITYAANFHREYFNTQDVHTNVTGAGTSRMQPFPRDWDELTGGVFGRFMGYQGLEGAERAFDLAPLGLKQASYDIVVGRFGPALAEAEASGGRGLDEVFPEPPGMDAWRAKREERIQRRDRELDLQQK